ncbi:hypothetical protein ACVJGC_002089 [Bradyrhizobium diazoefficiens]
MYAAIRQAKAKSGSAEELARRIKDGAVPIISDVDGFRAYYVVYAGDDTVTAISIFDKFEQAEEANRRAIAWIEKDLGPLLAGDARRRRGAGDRAYAGVVGRIAASQCRPGESQDPLPQGGVLRRVAATCACMIVRWLWVLAFARTTASLWLHLKPSASLRPHNSRAFENAKLDTRRVVSSRISVRVIGGSARWAQFSRSQRRQLTPMGVPSVFSRSMPAA